MIFTVTNTGNAPDSFQMSVATHLTPTSRGRGGRMPTVTYIFRNARVSKATHKVSTGPLAPGQSIQLRMQLDGTMPAGRTALVASLFAASSSKDPTVMRLLQTQMTVKGFSPARR